MEAGGPCQMISRSVAQIATASMRTSTSARLGTGTGLSVNFSSPGSPSTHAFMVSGTGMLALVFTPGGAYIVFSCEILLSCEHDLFRKPVPTFRDHARLRQRTAGLRPRSAHLGGERADGREDFLAHQGQVRVARPHGRRRRADRAHHRAVVVADRGADADR